MKILLPLIISLLIISCSNTEKKENPNRPNKKDKMKVKEIKGISYTESVDGEIHGLWKDNKRKGENVYVLHKLTNGQLKLKTIHKNGMSIEYDISMSISKGVTKYKQNHVGGIYYIVREDGSLEEYNMMKEVHIYEVLEQ